MADRRIGVLGATGAVGRVVAATLPGLGVGPLRLGARRPAPVRGAETVAVDAGSPDELAAFCTGCDVVVNCSGPLAAPPAVVALAALTAGAHYVDAGGGRAVSELAAAAAAASRTVLCDAGVLPGLSGLVPRWLAATGPGPPRVLTAYVSTFDRMSPGSAADFLLGMPRGNGDGGARTRWRGRDSRAPRPERRGDLALFPGQVTVYPYLPPEAERLAAAAGLAEVRWYHVFAADGRVLAALSRLGADLRRGRPLAELAAQLGRAADLDMVGRRPAQVLAFQLDGFADGRPVTRSAVLRAAGTYALTGSVAALAAADAAAGRLPAGAAHAAEVLDGTVLDRLPGLPGFSGLELLDQALAGGGTEEGTL